MAQALDFCLRCNSLKCRATLNERAVVTTCSLSTPPPPPFFAECTFVIVLMDETDTSSAFIAQTISDYLGETTATATVLHVTLAF